MTAALDRRPSVPAPITDVGVLAIARHLRPDEVGPIFDALLEGGIRAFELTLNDPEEQALATLSVAVHHAHGPDVAIGAGTVLSLDAARRAVDAGATFLVAPHLDVEVVAWAAGAGVPMLPGAGTPTEVLAGWRAGAAAVKVFPASSLGPAFIRELGGPFPRIPLLPTGGISVDTAATYIEAGAIGVGIGSWLFADRTPATIIDRARRTVEVVAAARVARAT